MKVKKYLTKKAGKSSCFWGLVDCLAYLWKYWFYNSLLQIFDVYIWMFKSDAHISFLSITLKEEGFCVCDGSNLFVPFIIASIQASVKGYIKPFLASFFQDYNQSTRLNRKGCKAERTGWTCWKKPLKLNSVRKTRHEAGHNTYSCTANDTMSLNPAVFLH